MPFKLGPFPVRRSERFLEAGKLIFKERVKIMTINYNVDEYNERVISQHPATVPAVKKRSWHVRGGQHHKGVQDFVFWKLAQVQYKNPSVQIVELKNMTPSPYITCYLEDGREVLFDVDSQNSDTILDRLIRTLGKSEETLEEEARLSEKKDNPANFGRGCGRWCICSVPGQVPCPGLVTLPKPWRGKYAFGLVEDEDS